MGCEVITMEDGSTMILCHSGRQSKAKCIVCDNPADFLCDYGEEGHTCDAPLCGKCRVNAGVRDYCPKHAVMAFV